MMHDVHTIALYRVGLVAPLEPVAPVASAASVALVAPVGGSKLVNIPAWKFGVPSGMDMECEGRNRSRKASGGIGPRI
jgi:hypothetical protein